MNKRKSSINFTPLDTPPVTPQQEDDYWNYVGENWLSTPASTISGPPKKQPSLFEYDRNFPPLSREVLSKNVPPITPSRETGFLSPEGSVSPLRNRLPTVAPLPPRPSDDNFSRPITETTDEKNNTISITPKKPVLLPIGQRQLSQQLQKNFPDVDSTIKEKADTFKERNENIDELVKKISSTEESEVTFEFEFFTGGINSEFNYFVKRFGFTNENMKFVDFLQSDFCKEILQSNDLKTHIETGNIYYQDTDTNGSIFEFMNNQQNISKGVIQTELKFDGSYKNYFQWTLNEFDAQQKIKFDIFSNKNTKYLVYRFNNFQNSMAEPLTYPCNR